PARITPVPGDPGAYRIETPHGVKIARRAAPPAAPLVTADVVEFRVFPAAFDADGDTLGTLHDTVVVAPGTLVRWVRAGPGFHTVTNGADSGDPTAAMEYSAIMDSATTSYERTFTTEGRHDFYCLIHEPLMEGSIIVTSATAGVTPPGLLRHPAFTRPPAPNPTRGDVVFAVALPRTQTASLSVHDVAGRTAVSRQSGVLTAGEHAFRWDGRAADGRRVATGRYFVRFAADEVRETRAVTLIR